MDKPYEEIRDELKKVSEAVFEMDRVKPQEHNWVDRGEVMSCENAGHPNHRAFKRRNVK